jgi:hypothetical protein
LATLSQLSQLPILLFLKEFKQLVQDDKFYPVVRSVNQQALKNLGLNKQTQKDEILSLTVEDYCSGPNPDKDLPGQIWVFGKVIKDQEVYIKLKTAEIGSEKIAKCISFHPADHQLCYPYKNPK